LKELPFKLEDIEQAYIGKQGCACGCGGNYYEQDNPKMLKSLITKALKLLKTENLERVGKDLKEHMIYSIELETKAIRFYVKKWNEVEAWIANLINGKTG